MIWQQGRESVVWKIVTDGVHTRWCRPGACVVAVTLTLSLSTALGRRGPYCVHFLEEQSEVWECRGRSYAEGKNSQNGVRNLGRGSAVQNFVGQSRGPPPGSDKKGAGGREAEASGRWRQQRWMEKRARVSWLVLRFPVAVVKLSVASF